MSKKKQTIRVHDYGHSWINRLAVVLDQFQKMENDKERQMAMNWLKSKYPQLNHADGSST